MRYSPSHPLNDLGGVNRWVWVLGLIVSLIFLAGFGLSAVMLYRFLTQGFLTVQDYVEIGFSNGWSLGNSNARKL